MKRREILGLSNAPEDIAERTEGVCHAVLWGLWLDH